MVDKIVAFLTKNRLKNGLACPVFGMAGFKMAASLKIGSFDNQTGVC